MSGATTLHRSFRGNLRASPLWRLWLLSSRRPASAFGLILAVSLSSLRDDVLVLFHGLIFILLVEPAQEPTVGTALCGAPPCSFLFHTMYSVGDIERLLERGEARRARFSATTTHRGEQRRVQGNIVEIRAGGGWWGRCGRGLTPWMVEEFVDRIALGRVNAEEMRDEILGYD